MDEAETAARRGFLAAPFLVGGPWNTRSPGPFLQLARIGRCWIGRLASVAASVTPC
jgi:hypothetical protein